MATADCNTCGWFKNADRSDTAADWAATHEHATGHTDIDVYP